MQLVLSKIKMKHSICKHIYLNAIILTH